MDTDYRNVNTDIWIKSFELFMCQKDETLNEMEARFKVLTDNLWRTGVRMTNDEHISKLTTALPAKWDKFMVELKQKDFFPELFPRQFFNEVRGEFYKEEKKRRDFLSEMEKNLNELELDVLIEVDRRICVFLATKRILKYDIKRKFYIDDNINPIDFVKLFRAGTDKMETKDAPKDEESVETGSSSSASVCSKCDSFKTENDKLLKDAESLTSEIKKLEDVKQADDKQILILKENCEKLMIENDKLLSNLKSLIFENKKLKEKEKVFEEKIKDFEIEKSRSEKEFQNQMKILEDGRNVFSQNNIEKQKLINSHLQKIIKLEKECECARKKIEELEKELESNKKSSENEDFWIKLEKKNLKANESKFQEQIKILENEKSVLENLKNENENSIKYHLERISQFEKEAENSRNKIDELEKKLIGFVTSSDSLKYPCPKPINSVSISEKVTNFDNVKVEDCDEKSNDENEKLEKQKLFLKTKEKFQKTVLQSTEKGECSKQKPLKKKVEQKQKENKSSSDRSSNRNEKLQKVKNENSKIVGNKWCRSDYSAQKQDLANLRKEYHQAKQCYDLSVWCEGHIAVNCQNRSYETRRCFNCNIKGHIVRDCPRKSYERSRVVSQKVAKIPVKVKPQEQKVLKPKVQEQSIQEKKVKLSQGQKDRLRKKRKKAREYLEKILSSGSSFGKNKSSDESTPSAAKSRKMNSSDTNLRTKEEKKKKMVGDESDRSKSDKPPAGNDSGVLKPEEPLVEVKKENSGLTMDDANFPPLLNKNLKSPKDRQAWVNLFK
ncbi:putative transcription factor interactor and regulator CCHC(Zn) family [Helianthus anomalus]